MLKESLKNYHAIIFPGEGNKAISLIFSNLERKNLRLWNTGDTQWNIINIKPAILTTSLKVVINSVYGHSNNGFKEIEINGCIVP